MTPSILLRNPVWLGSALTIVIALAGVMPSRAELAGADTTQGPGSTTLIPFPFLFYSDETKLGGGASLSYVTRSADAPVDARPASYGLLALYTERDQYSVGVSVDRYFAEERWHLGSELGFLEFPGDFFGFGNATDADSSEVYTPRGAMFGLNLERKIRGRWQTGPALVWYTRDIVQIESGGRLDRDRPVGAEDGTVLTLGWTATWDGRSHVFYPRSGGWLRWQSAFASEELVGDYSYSHHTLDLRHYRSLGEERWGAPVFAVRGLAVHSAGSIPFDLMPTLGGSDLLRGYFGGRFRDHALAALQAELRMGHWKRCGVVFFAETATVADGIGRLRLADLHASYGVGLRVQLSRAEKIHIRADLGLADDGGSGFYLDFLEAF